MSAATLFAVGCVVIVLAVFGIAILPSLVATLDHINASVGRIGR